MRPSIKNEGRRKRRGDATDGKKGCADQYIDDDAERNLPNPRKFNIGIDNVKRGRIV